LIEHGRPSEWKDPAGLWALNLRVVRTEVPSGNR